MKEVGKVNLLSRIGYIDCWPYSSDLTVIYNSTVSNTNCDIILMLHLENFNFSSIELKMMIR